MDEENSMVEFIGVGNLGARIISDLDAKIFDMKVHTTLLTTESDPGWKSSGNGGHIYSADRLIIFARDYRGMLDEHAIKTQFAEASYHINDMLIPPGTSCVVIVFSYTDPIARGVIEDLISMLSSRGKPIITISVLPSMKHRPEVYATIMEHLRDFLKKTTISFEIEPRGNFISLEQIDRWMEMEVRNYSYSVVNTILKNDPDGWKKLATTGMAVGFQKDFNPSTVVSSFEEKLEEFLHEYSPGSDSYIGLHISGSRKDLERLTPRIKDWFQKATNGSKIIVAEDYDDTLSSIRITLMITKVRRRDHINEILRNNVKKIEDDRKRREKIFRKKKRQSKLIDFL